MKTHLKIALLASAFGAFAVQAHDGASGAVKQRMDAMGEIRGGMKVLGSMAGGKLAFDAEAAKAAAAQIEAHSAMIPMLFKEQDTTAPSEARETIWENFDDFTDMAEAMEKAAIAAQSVSDLDELRGAVRRLGKSCKDCHADYRL